SARRRLLRPRRLALPISRRDESLHQRLHHLATILPAHFQLNRARVLKMGSARRLARCFWRPAKNILLSKRKHSARRRLLRPGRSEERRVGKECRSRWWPDY